MTFSITTGVRRSRWGPPKQGATTKFGMFYPVAVASEADLGESLWGLDRALYDRAILNSDIGTPEDDTSALNAALPRGRRVETMNITDSAASEEKIT